jgi:YrbI family 3-deoxy-D-manno-octulosonate 8-phosphate phosphatase
MGSRNESRSQEGMKILFMDVDGVLTDGGMYYSEEGEVLKKFNTRDGMGIQLAREKGIIPVIITKERSPIVEKRAEKLQVKEVYTGVEDKLEKALEVLSRHHLSFGEAAFIGDDINDIPLLLKVGISFCPADAAEDVKRAVTRVCKKNGGEGVVREVVDSLIQSRMHLER